MRKEADLEKVKRTVHLFPDLDVQLTGYAWHAKRHHHLVQAIKIHCRIDFPQQMSLRYLAVYPCDLYHIPFHFQNAPVYPVAPSSLFYLIQMKKPSFCWTFSTD